MVSKFAPEPVYTDIGEGHFICPDLGHTALRVVNWEPGKRSETIAYSREKDHKFLDGINFEEDTTPSVKTRILDMIRQFWDVYSPEGLKNPMLGYEFAIDTGAHTPYCCKKPSYGSNEGDIIMSHV